MTKTLGLGRKSKAAEEVAPVAAPEPALMVAKAKRGRKVVAAPAAPESAPAAKKRGRPAKARPEVADDQPPQRPEPMVD